MKPEEKIEMLQRDNIDLRNEIVQKDGVIMMLKWGGGIATVSSVYLLLKDMSHGEPGERAIANFVGMAVAWGVNSIVLLLVLLFVGNLVWVFFFEGKGKK